MNAMFTEHTIKGCGAMLALRLFRSEETRRALGAVLGQIGRGLFAKSLISAIKHARDADKTVGTQFFLSFWERLGQREAVIDGKHRITFGEFRDSVLCVTDILYSLGMREGDACAVLLYNSATWFEINQACNLSGIAMPLLNWHLSPEELTKCVSQSNAKLLIIDPEFLEGVMSVRGELGAVQIVVTGDQPVPDGVYSLTALKASATPQLHPGKFHISAKTFSGGTTGTPKFINMDQAAMFGKEDLKRRGATREEAIRMAIMQLSALGWYGLGKLHDPITGNARSLIPGPLYHAGVQVAVLPFLFGGTVVPMRTFSPEAFLRTIQEERINWTFVAPTMLERVLALPEDVKASYHLGSMRSLVCAAAPCAPEVKQAINELFRRQGAGNDVFHEYYGASETGIITILLPRDYQEDPRRYRSVGKVRAAECRIFDVEAQGWADTGKPGKVLLRSALTFGLQYVGDQKKTDDCYIEVDGKIWYDDGLIGYFDQSQFLYLTSREKEMIISGGVNIFPNEIEEIIKRHPAVLDVAVVRAPDKDLGEVPAAVVHLREGAQSTREDIINHCRKSGLYGFKLPRRVDFAELPRNLAGKLPKKQLEERYWSGAEQFG